MFRRKKDTPYFDDAARPTGVLTVEVPLTAEQAKKLAAQYVATHQGGAVQCAGE
jgi:hypothetical protein